MTEIGRSADALAAAIAAVHATGETPVRFAAGSVPVYGLGERAVLKLFPAAEREHFDTERRALGFLHGKLPIATPDLLAHGEDGPWLWLLMSRIRGAPLADVWTQLDVAARERVMRQAGEALAALHALPLHGLPLDGLNAAATPWAEFIADRHAHCVQRQRDAGLAEPWLERIAHWLDAHPPPFEGRVALLHTEVMREHLFAVQHDGSWQLSGLIDFEPSMLGPPAYEFASVGVFLSAGDPGLLAAVLQGYGLRPDRTWREQVFTCLLLHRYSRLRWYLDRLGVPDDTPLESLVDQWFGTTAQFSSPPGSPA